MASKIEICNIALGKCGAKSIRSFDEDNKLARACESAYDIHREALLTNYDWSFSLSYAQLAQLDETGTDVMPYVLALPSDCVRPREVHPFSPTISWMRVGKKIISNTESLTLIYSSNVTDTSVFPAYFVLALAGQIADQIAILITQDTKILDKVESWSANNLIIGLDTDASTNYEHKRYDDTADNDSFVNP